MSITKNERTPLVGATQTSTFGAVVTSFNSSGNFVAPPATTSVTYLVLAGGGAGGRIGGGGGDDGRGGRGFLLSFLFLSGCQLLPQWKRRRQWQTCLFLRVRTSFSES